MKITVLGSGEADVIKCYNTCWTISTGGGTLLVDGGGGNTILNQLDKANIKISDIHDIVLTHNHTDHILGLIWVIRIVCREMLFDRYKGILNIYAHDVSCDMLKRLMVDLFPLSKKFIDDRITFNVVQDGETRDIIGLPITFFDIHARKEKQYGFYIDKKLAFTGDEPLQKEVESKIKGCEWLLHESFCLESEEEKFKAHYKGHCTVREAAENATRIGAKNLLVWHTEDNDLANRKRLYTQEAKKYFKGNVYVPEDLDVIEIK